MVRNYKKKTSRGDWSEESMKDAVKNVVDGKIGYRLAAKSFSVPQTILERKVKLARESSDKNDPKTVKFKVPLGPKEQAFTDNTHTKNIDLINEARNHGVIILCFPPHTTHRLQVADVSYMRPLSTYYDHQITAWLRSNPGMTVTVRQVAEIFGKAFIQASTMSTAVNGFKKCGIWPYGPTVFSESDSSPSLMTDIQLNVSDAPASDNTMSTLEPECSNCLDNPDSQTPQQPISGVVSPQQVSPFPASTPEPGCSNWLDNSDLQLHERPRTPQQSIFGVVSPQQIMPFPATRKTSRVTRKRGKTAVITSSPYKNELEETIKKKKQVEEDKLRKKLLREHKISQKKPATEKRRG